ncbi:MAG: nucleotidyltransferase [Ignavibacteriaceae bacterium]|nr:nucleotidyltransferase [Ignavibacteriaceae bacterium]
MTKFEISLRNLDFFFSENSVEYVIIGGIAVIVYGEQRTTRDIDATVLCELEDLDSFHKLIEKKFTPAFKNTLDYLKRNFILPVDDPDTNLRIDIAAGLTEFDKNVIKRKIKRKYGKVEIFVCSLEDLIIYKLFAGRDQDVSDVKSLIVKNFKIDKSYLLSTAEKFRELEREDIIDNLNKFLQDVS